VRVLDAGAWQPGEYARAVDHHRVGRVTVIAAEPLMELLAAPGESPRTLVIYGHIGQGYRVEEASSMSSALWSSIWTGALTNLVQPIPEASFTNPMRYFRALEWP